MEVLAAIAARWPTYVHPLVGTISILAAAYAASLAFEGRNRPYRGTLSTHRRIGPWVAALVVAAWVGGVASVVWLRDDLELAESRHFWLGSAITILVVASVASSRWIDRPAVRLVHPWFGATALVLSGFQTLLGFGLLP